MSPDTLLFPHECAPLTYSIVNSCMSNQKPVPVMASISLAAGYAHRRKIPYLVSPRGMLSTWCLNNKSLRKRVRKALPEIAARATAS